MHQESIEIGSRFNRWEVVSGPEIRAFTKRGKRIWFWLCRCDCGTERWVNHHNLRHGVSTSCGCRQREVTRDRSYKHGGSVGRVMSPLFSVFKNMHRRCEDPRATYFQHYGGRGISVCKEWSEYTPFRLWALANGYSAELSIDRIDVDGPYSPANCRWTDAQMQMNNTRRNRWIEAFGERKTVAQWARDPRCTVGAYALWDRVYKLGWTVEVAISTPLGAIKTGPK